METVRRSVPDAIVAAIRNLALYPPNELDALLDIIASFAPRFAAAVRELFKRRGQDNV